MIFGGFTALKIIHTVFFWVMQLCGFLWVFRAIYFLRLLGWKRLLLFKVETLVCTYHTARCNNGEDRNRKQCTRVNCKVVREYVMKACGWMVCCSALSGPRQILRTRRIESWLGLRAGTDVVEKKNIGSSMPGIQPRFFDYPSLRLVCIHTTLPQHSQET